MKAIVYSEVPKAPSYVHLAYLSTGTARLVSDSMLQNCIFMGVLSVFMLALGSKLKLGAKVPRLWRLAVFVLVTLTLLVLFVALFVVPAETRGLKLR
jgi:hypothetical protein